ncbi:hypothetical protein ACFY8X_38690 [Streptomyces tanashiensis]|jgi:hypothetical protein|uniref:hypothetical protein n=1 Tax=Streptomyces tanashiensis TaxID=67367 RepID=UPI0036EA451D
MRVTLSTEGRTVQIITSPRDKTSLRAVESAALRLYRALPGPDPEPAKKPIGFAGPLDADTELGPDADEETTE